MANSSPEKQTGGGGTGSAAGKAVFVDTSGFFALLCTRDPAHPDAKKRVAAFVRTRRRTVTTDYVLDETFSLLKARGLRHLSTKFRAMYQGSKVLRVEWTQPTRFEQATEFFLKQLDQDYSLTDCVSFLVMQEHGLAEALTTDHHFRIAGFKPLLVPS